jgi:hypothetical protein
MELFQILNCGGTLGNCCSNSTLISILSVTKRILNIVQFIVPIVLIIAGTIQMVQLTVNPDLKDGFRKVLNKLIAALIIFLIPTIVDVFLGMTEVDYSVASCWEQAKAVSKQKVFGSGEYTATPTIKSSIWLNPISFSKLSSLGIKKSGTSKQQEIVAYAEKFVGEEYVFGGYWDGEEPYTPTDCSGFVTAIFRHFGIDLPRGVNMFGYDTSLYDEVDESELEPGDVIMYDGHVGIYTGKGKEIIHAASTRLGVIKSDDYSKCSSHAILGFLRIKGVK